MNNTPRAHLRRLMLSALSPESDQAPSEWAEQNLILAGEVAVSGPLSLRDTPFMRSFIDAFGDKTLTDLAVQGGPQTGKSMAAMAGLGWTLPNDPRDAIWVGSTLPNARSFSQNRWKPTVDASPSLSILKPADDDRFTNMEQAFQGAVVTFTGSGSNRNVAQRTKEIVIIDEIDKIDDAAVIAQADARAFAAAYPKRVKFSEPEFEDGPIHQAWLLGDGREWELCCARCGGFFLPTLEMLRWTPDARLEDGWDYDQVERSTVLVCPKCGGENDESSRIASVREGREVKTRVAATGHASWRWPQWLAPWPAAAWGKLAVAFLKAKKTFNLKDVENKINARPVKNRGERVESAELKKRTYPARQFPLNAWLTTVSVDTQDDRLEGQIIAWGDGKTSWQVEYVVIQGDPELESTWADLSDWLFKTRRAMPWSICLIDSQGHHTEMVYRFAKANAKHRVFACRGSNKPWGPVAGRPRRQKEYGIKLYNLGTSTAKSWLMTSFRLDPDKPGAAHFRDDMDDEYFKQLASEELRAVKGRYGQKEYVKVAERNEALDLWVYGYAGLIILGEDRALARAKARVMAAREAGQAPAAAATGKGIDLRVVSEPAPSAPSERARVIAPRRRVVRGNWMQDF